MPKTPSAVLTHSLTRGLETRALSARDLDGCMTAEAEAFTAVSINSQSRRCHPESLKRKETRAAQQQLQQQQANMNDGETLIDFINILLFFPSRRALTHEK
jgi:hypothetical protein